MLGRSYKARFALAFGIIVLIGLVRIVLNYRQTAITSDEPPNIAAGMQYLDLGLYDYGPFHPPLARLAIAAGPYLVGYRAQKHPDRWEEGKKILHSGRSYHRALYLARFGVLPFFVLACCVVWLWGRRSLGEWQALVAVFLFSNLPIVLAHSGVATNDAALMACIALALYRLTRWWEDASWWNAGLLGLGCGLAFLSKFSALLYVPLAALVLLAMQPRAVLREWRRRLPQLLGAIGIMAIVVWGAYGFSFGRMSEPIDPEATREGGLLTRTAATVLNAMHGMPLPAPKLWDGISMVRQHEAGGHPGFLMGKCGNQGWWYFFPVALAVKIPLGFLLLALASAAARWKSWVPAAFALVILLASLPQNLNIGLRYLLPMFPMLSIAAAAGFAFLWERRRWARVAACVLLVWMTVSSVLAHGNYLAYFNEIAGARPERILVDSDLDWGQDVERLAVELQRRGVQHVHTAVFYTGDIDKLGFPAWDALEPYKPVHGWIAISYTWMKTFACVISEQKARKDSPFGWLTMHQPVAKVGRSIVLYHVE